MWEYEEAVKLIEEFGINTNEVTVGNIEVQIIAEYEFECERMKNNGRKMTPKAKLEARETILSRVTMWLQDGFVGEVTAKTISTYRPSYLFFKLLGNSVESFQNEESIDLKETCGIPDTNILSILDYESTEFSEEWFISKVIGNINHLISGDKSHYTFQYHTVMDIGTIYDSSKDIFYFFASVK